jgi:molybdate transport system substrate-binding protein
VSPKGGRVATPKAPRIETRCARKPGLDTRTLRARYSTTFGAVLLLTGCTMYGEPAPPEPQGTLVVFAAASLAETFDQLEIQFERLHPRLDVVMNYGGSAALATQIVEGAPADFFVSASEEAMEPIIDAGLTAHPVDLATNSLMIAVPPGNPGDVDGLRDLSRPELAIALCAVEVPCGALAARVLDAAGVVPSVDSYEQDALAVLTKVELDEVDAALVYRTDVLAAGDRVEGIEFPGAEDATTLYQYAAPTSGANSTASSAMSMYLQGEWVRQLLEEAGFGAPE